MASTYIIKIEDTNGRQCKIEMTIPFMPKIGPHRGSWRSLDKGFLRYDSGGTHFVPANERGNEGDLYFFLEDYPPFGMQFEKMHNFWGVNDMGAGKLPRDWVLCAEPGWVKWVVIKVL